MIASDFKPPRCLLCPRAAISNNGYCTLHEAALSTVKKRFPDWQKALGDISWERYLERIIGLKETGDSSRDIARHLLSRTGQ